MEFDYATIEHMRNDDPSANDNSSMHIKRSKEHIGKEFGQYGGKAQSIIPCPEPGAEYVLSARAWSEILTGESPGEVAVQFLTTNGVSAFAPILEFPESSYTNKSVTFNVPADAAWCRVWFRKTGEGDMWVDNISLKATVDDTPSSVPSNLTAVLVGASQVKLAWDPVPGAIGYEIERKYASETDNRYRPAGKAFGGSVEFLDLRDLFTSNMLPGSNYNYQVRAISDYGFSGWSSAIAVQTAVLTTSPGDTTYYIDASTGDDVNSGTTSNTAWQSFINLDRMALVPNDQVLLNRSESWNEPLFLHGSGSAAKPITVSSYGTGDLPYINPECRALQAIKLRNSAYWEFSELELSNFHPFWREYDRVGLRVVVDSADTINHIYVDGLYIHDLRSMTERGSGRNGGTGIQMYDAENETLGKLNDVRIENCRIERVEHFPILTRKADNVIIRNNKLIRGGYAGMIVRDANPALLEGNFVSESGIYQTSRDNAGVGFYSCDGLIFQSNVVNRTYNENSGQSVNVDKCRNSIIQYNFLKDSAEGSFVITQAATNNVYRYNVCQGVQGEWFRNFGSVGTRIYNNTVYLESGNEATLVENRESGVGLWAVDTEVYNNIFYVDGHSAGMVIGGANGMIIDGNVYHGNIDTVPPEDAHALTENPQLVNPGSGIADTNRFSFDADGYQLKPTSPCIFSGIIVTNNGGADFWSNPVPAGYVPSRGAHQQRIRRRGEILLPCGDSYARFVQPDAVSGDNDTLGLRGEGNPLHGYIKFCVNAVSGAVGAVTLNLYSHDGGDIQVKQVTDNNWDEDTLTWNNRPAMGTLLDAGTAVSNVWINFDLSGYISSTGTYSIGLDTTKSNRQNIATKESGSLSPYLEIVYGSSEGENVYYQDWAGSHGLTGTDVDYEADPDADGLINLQEYAFGGNPAAGPELPPVVPAHSIVDGGDQFKYTYKRHREAAALGLDYLLETNDNLLETNSWVESAFSVSGVQSINAEYEAVTNQVPTQGKDEQFARLRILID